MTDTETLYCEPGNHKWQRVKKRGRKPTHCEKHAPVILNNEAGTKTDSLQTLHCEIGNHTWQRPSQRGVKPHNCPEHKPAGPARNLIDPSAGTVMRVLHCAAGDHDWKRPPTRGRVPVNCPQHSTAVAPRSVPVRIVSDSFPLAEIPEDELPLVEVDEEYESETTPEEQRELLTAAFNPAPKKRGRPRIHETPEEAAEAALAKSRARVDELEISLKANGTHLSQQAPYRLYKLVAGIAGTKNAKYDYVRDFSPLARAQMLNQFEDRFLAGIYYFERDGKKVEEED